MLCRKYGLISLWFAAPSYLEDTRDHFLLHECKQGRMTLIDSLNDLFHKIIIQNLITQSAPNIYSPPPCPENQSQDESPEDAAHAAAAYQVYRVTEFRPAISHPYDQRSIPDLEFPRFLGSYQI
jgi:hypothetical protein